MPKVSESKIHAVEDGSAITVSAQQSRYHVDAQDPTTNEIDVRDLSISIGRKEIISHANLHLHPNSHYVLVGRNGTGKSTLLKAIAEGRIPGISWSLRILLLGQTKAESDDEKTGYGGDESVLTHVLRSDKVREKLLREAEVLSKALESGSGARPVRAYRGIEHARLLEEVNEARQIYLRRSGARGAKAKKELIGLEEKVVVSEARLVANLDGLEPATLSSETQAAAGLLISIQTSLELMDSAAAEAKARNILRGLGFPADTIDRPFKQLSGGWRTRCDIASALCQPADILLLDEPTNFLDLPSIIWLQSYIESLENTTVVLVTHDRDFADAISSNLLILRNQVLELFKGNLSTYERSRYKKAKYMTRMRDAQAKQTAHIQSSISNNIRSAKKSGDDNKLKQAASRQKKLDERTGLQVSAKGGRFKLNRDLGGYHLTSRAEIKVPDFDPPVKLLIPSVPPYLRFPGALVHLDNVSFTYPKSSTPILKNVNLTIHPRSRTGIVGLNGAGKSTLISLITSSLVPKTGTLTRHPRLQTGLFSQQAVETLTTLAQQTPTLTALAYIAQQHPALSDQEARALLSGLGLPHQIASLVPLAHLSGGQKVRLALADVLAQPPQLLVLDEVTTHLDADTISSLAAALKRYEGALVVVSHDRWFVRVVVEGQGAFVRRGWDTEDGDGEDSGESSADEVEAEGREAGIVYRVHKGGVKVLERGMDRYEEIASKEADKLAASTS